MNWFRWYTGTATDPKFLVVARSSGQNVAAVVAVWAMLLERASDGVTRGDASVTQCDATKRGFVTGFDCESADVLLGLEPGASAAILEALRKKGLLSGDEVTNWKKRQPKREDSSAERTRAYRERLKEKQCDASVTQCDARREEKREDINNPLDTTYLSPKGEAREKAKRFVPPTVEEVRAYCEERGNGIDAEAFHAFYASNGWKVGRNAMRDWRCAVKTWECKRREEGNLPALQGQQMPKATTVAQQRYVEQDAMARMLLQDRRMRDAQAGRHAQDHDEPCLTLPPGW